METYATRAADAAAAKLAVGVVSYALGIPTQHILDHQRGSSCAAFARHVAMYLCHVAFEFSLTRVAIAFFRDRSTVAVACHAVEDRREDPRFDQWVAGLEHALREAPARAEPAEVGR